MIAPVTRESKIALVALLRADGIGNRRATELIKQFGSLDRLFSAPAGEISAALNQPLSIGRAVHQAGRDLAKAGEVVAKAEKCGARILTWWDDDYPTRLKNIPDAPLILYCRGLTSPLYDYSVAVVGTRAPSEHGKRLGFRIGCELAQAGVTVVSGLAVGVDSEAHNGALTAGGRTVAVLGTGIDVVYPSTNRLLFERIVEQGAVMTDYPPGQGPEPHNFPTRNRIISGISLGVVVVEAGLKSGALITARYAIEQGRDLFAVPGPAGMPRSIGVNRLIKDGAGKMVESAAEIIEALRSPLAPVMNVAATLALPKLPEREGKLYALLETGAVLIDELIQKSGMGAVEVNQLLTAMQIQGLVRRYPGAKIGRA